MIILFPVSCTPEYRRREFIYDVSPEKRFHQHIWIDGKKLTVLSAKLSFPQGRLTVEPGT